MSDDERFSIRDVLATIREELAAAHADAAQNANAAMRLEQCELEFAVELERKAGGGVSVWVAELEAGGHERQTNRIRLRFESSGIAVAKGGVGPGISFQTAMASQPSGLLKKGGRIGRF